MAEYTELIKALRHCSEDDDACATCQRWIAHDEWGIKCKGRLISDAAAAIEALEAEIAELKRVNLEIFEDLPKRGEWIEEGLDNFRKYKVTCPHCGEWYIGNYDAYDEPSDFNYCPHCGNICNPQNIELEKMQAERAKMEVQS